MKWILIILPFLLNTNAFLWRLPLRSTPRIKLNPTVSVLKSGIRLKPIYCTGTNQNNYFENMDAYQILDVSRNADKREIKSAFKKMVGKWHPDKFPGDEKKQMEGGQRLEKINRAYFCLSDDERRSRYDQYGEAGVGNSASAEEQLKSGDSNVQFSNDISEVFESIFGGKKKINKPSVGKLWIV